MSSEVVDVGTIYVDDSQRLELRVTGVGRISIARQCVDDDWKWSILRSWVSPNEATTDDIDLLLRALGIRK